MSTFFSVIIPALNEQEYLPHLLEDITHQTTKDFEVVLVDAHSTDATVEKAKTFASKFPLHITLSAKKNVSYQRNKGAFLAKGDYCVFLDADVRLAKDFLTQVKMAAYKKNTGIFLPHMLPDDSSQKTKVLISFVNTLIRMSQTYGKPLAPGGNLIVATPVFKHIGGFAQDLFISEDHDFVRRAYKMGYKAKILPHAKLHMSMRRSKLEGDMTLIYKYIIAFLMYTMSPNALFKKKIFDYEMGGQRYDEGLKHKAGDNRKKKRLNIIKLRQFLQLSVLLASVGYFSR